MRTHLTKPSTSFTPIKIIVTVESEEEALSLVLANRALSEEDLYAGLQRWQDTDNLLNDTRHAEAEAWRHRASSWGLELLGLIAQNIEVSPQWDSIKDSYPS